MFNSNLRLVGVAAVAAAALLSSCERPHGQRPHGQCLYFGPGASDIDDISETPDSRSIATSRICRALDQWYRGEQRHALLYYIEPGLVTDGKGNRLEIPPGDWKAFVNFCRHGIGTPKPEDVNMVFRAWSIDYDDPGLTPDLVPVGIYEFVFADDSAAFVKYLEQYLPEQDD